ncbi:head maturation protease, ClpP-related [Derxia gummosa]|uniref:ATP-dependent Clp protease proteolytic subunit n=1 Tax=Derxia gummosa DSM 723 TaxID=1121388 RepID=A0A8B6X2Z5_9BURK|nr:head maturation protease, ClpP-related [Derxia gummosa]
MRNQLLRLLAENRRPFSPVESRIVRAAGSNEATVYLYDAIVGDRASAEWFGGVCPQDFVPALAAIEADVIHLRINSPGGDVFASEAISQALREHPAAIVGHIDGVAASAATAIACACNEVIAAPKAMYMIHQSWTFAIGNADDMDATSALLRKADAGLLATYADFTGMDAAGIEAQMKAETWFNSEEAMAAGFVTAIAEPVDKAAKQAKASAWMLGAYARAPAATPDAALTEPEVISAERRARMQQRIRLLDLAPIV